MNNTTPGPWIASTGFEDEEDRWIVTVDGGDTGMNYVIAMIHNGAPGDTLETEEANARLFAAAPDLLAALKELTAALDEATDQLDIEAMLAGNRMSDARDAACAAILKAEGKGL